MRIRTTFPRFQEYFTLIIEPKTSTSPSKTGKMYVGKYFTAKGEFDEVLIFSNSLLFSYYLSYNFGVLDKYKQDAFKTDVKQHVEGFVQKDYKEVEYNHKMD